MKKGLSLAIKIAIPVIILVIILIIRFRIVDHDTLSIAKYIVISLSGADSRGEATASLDEVGLYAALAGANASAEEKSSYHKFVESVRFSLDKKSELSNGDTIVISVSYSQSEADKLKLSVSDADRNYKVNGLPQCTKIDLFQDIKIITGGTSPFMTVSYTNESETAYLQSLQYEFSKTNHIAIGDTITITCLADTESAVAQGYYFDETTMQYTIETADFYVADIADVPTDILASLQTQDLEAIQTVTNDTTSHITYEVTDDQGYLYRDGNEEALNFSYLGAQIAMNATATSLEHENYLLLFYRGSIRIPNYSGSEDPYDYLDAVFCFLYDDLIVTTDGGFVMATNDPELRYVCASNYELCLQEARNRIGAGYEYTEYALYE